METGEQERKRGGINAERKLLGIWWTSVLTYEEMKHTIIQLVFSGPATELCRRSCWACFCHERKGGLCPEMEWKRSFPPASYDSGRFILAGAAPPSDHPCNRASLRSTLPAVWRWSEACCGGGGNQWLWPPGFTVYMQRSARVCTIAAEHLKRLLENTSVLLKPALLSQFHVIATNKTLHASDPHGTWQLASFVYVTNLLICCYLTALQVVISSV